MSALTILRLDASMHRSASCSRRMCDELITRLSQDQPTRVIVRDLADGLPFIDEAWIEASFTDRAERSAQQKAVLAVSDELVDELRQADILVMGVPIYNFGPPAAFKAWIDLIARARETFQYTREGPRGLLDIRKGYLVVASGGTEVGGDTDYVTGYTKILFGFLGVTEMDIIPCDDAILTGEENVEEIFARLKTL